MKPAARTDAAACDCAYGDRNDAMRLTKTDQSPRKVAPQMTGEGHIRLTSVHSDVQVENEIGVCACVGDAVGSMAGMLIPLSSLACTCEANVSMGFRPDKRTLLFLPPPCESWRATPLLRPQTKIERQNLKPKNNGRSSGIPDSHAEEQNKASPGLSAATFLFITLPLLVSFASKHPLLTQCDRRGVSVVQQF